MIKDAASLGIYVSILGIGISFNFTDSTSPSTSAFAKNNVVNEGEEDGENNNNWLNKSMDWLTGGNESEVDKIKNKQNPSWKKPKL